MSKKEEVKEEIPQEEVEAKASNEEESTVEDQLEKSSEIAPSLYLFNVQSWALFWRAKAQNSHASTFFPGWKAQKYID